ncbi:MAG TPA: Uma2 family endonuclease [Pirellulales bacterium]|nr:Uma2 family endonuclease [Pirellulales bacterium]
MATIPSSPRLLGAGAEIEYPTGDGRPVAETPLHFMNLKTAVETLDRHFKREPLVYVWGNMFVYYEKGNRHKHVSPDVFVALDVPKDKPREAYLIWEEGHGLDLVVELTSKSTREEDLDDKMSIYQDEIVVPEYFLFDPKGEYLDPPLQGHRLREGKYFPIEMVNGRLPSEVLGLHLQRDGEWLRFYNPATGHWLPTSEELLLEAQAERERAEAERERAEAERERAEEERERLAKELDGSGEELKRLRQELEEWRRRFGEHA